MSALTEIPAIAELGELGPRFCLWTTVVRDGKPTKIPILPTTGKAASSTDPATWAPFADCVGAQKRRRASGVGFFFNGDGYGGVDLDACRDPATDELADWAQRWVSEINSYTEVSPSGTGVKIYFKADPMPKLRGNKRTVGEAADGEKVPAVELYVTGRYFALTGQHLDGTPDEIVNATEAVERLVLWIAEGQAGGGNDDEAADFADLPEMVAQLLDTTPDLKAAWTSGEKLTKGPDSSSSGRDWSLMLWLVQRDHDDAMIEEALRAYPHGQVRKMDAKTAARRVRNLLREAGKIRDRRSRTREAAVWSGDLIMGDRGPLDHVANVVVVLEADPAFKAAIRFDELRNNTVVGTLPWHACDDWREWTDRDDIAMARWCALRGLPVRPGTVADAVLDFAKSRSFNPLRDRLDTMAWDGVPRLGDWLVTYLGTADDAYTRAVGRAWMISAVARVYRPGCKADHALILEGPQGAFKSTACAILALEPAWFADEIAELGSKDSAQDLRGKWIVELGELSSMTRASVEKVKAFISRTFEHYRPSYGRYSQDFPRRCVFIGSTNADAYLADETGNRRFWPIKVGTVDPDALHRDVEQLWAEAVVAFQAGERWHLSRELEAHARERQAERRTVDPWEQPIMEWAERQIGPVTIADALGHVAVDIGRRTQVDANRVARIFKAHGWERYRYREGGSLCWGYRPVPGVPSPEPPSGNGKPSNSVAIPSVPSVPSRAETYSAKRSGGRWSAGIPTHASAICDISLRGDVERGNTGNARGNARFSVPGLPDCSQSASEWQDVDHWRSRLHRAVSPAERRAVTLAWAEAAGASVTELDDGPPRVTLPGDLPNGLALAELRQHARGQGLLS